MVHMDSVTYYISYSRIGYICWKSGSSLPKFSTMYAGTKIPLFVLKPMISLGITGKFKKQSNNRFEYSSVYIHMWQLGQKKKDEKKIKDEKTRIECGKELEMLLRTVSSTICVTSHLSTINVST